MTPPTSLKPPDYNSVVPYLAVNGAGETIVLLVERFAAVALRRFPDDAGRGLHAEVRFDDSVLMLAGVRP